jgi:hypothetical protein
MPMTFTDAAKAKAVTAANGELAWNKDDVASAIAELIAADFAVLGGEVWLSVRKAEIPTLTQLNDKRFILGLIKGKDGKDYVFHWDCEKKADEIWSEYVRRSGQEALSRIREMNVEELSQGRAVTPRSSLFILHTPKALIQSHFLDTRLMFNKVRECTCGTQKISQRTAHVLDSSRLLFLLCGDNARIFASAALGKNRDAIVSCWQSRGIGIWIILLGVTIQCFLLPYVQNGICTTFNKRVNICISVLFLDSDAAISKRFAQRISRSILVSHGFGIAMARGQRKGI